MPSIGDGRPMNVCEVGKRRMVVVLADGARFADVGNVDMRTPPCQHPAHSGREAQCVMQAVLAPGTSASRRLDVLSRQPPARTSAGLAGLAMS